MSAVITTIRRTWLTELFAAWKVRRLRTEVASLEWYVEQLERAQRAHRRLAEQKRVDLARWER